MESFIDGRRSRFALTLAVMQPHNFLLQKLVGARSGPLSFNKCSVASVDKLAEQNGHKAELQALRQEANRGDEERGYRISPLFFLFGAA